MYAICNVSGQQIKAEPGRTQRVSFLKKNKEGDKLVLDEVLLVSDGSVIKVGTPHVKATVHATVVAHGRGDKIIVYHKQRRGHYHKMRGHHQQFTQIRIDSIEA